MDITAKTDLPARRGMAFGESRLRCGANIIVTITAREAA